LNDRPPQESNQRSSGTSREMRELFRECDEKIQKRRAGTSRDQWRQPRSVRLSVRRTLQNSVTLCTSMAGNVFDLCATIAQHTTGFSLLRSKIIWVMVAVLSVMAVAPRFSGLMMSQATAHEILLKIWEEGKRKRSSEIDISELSEFQARSNAQLQEVIPLLQRKADIDDQVTLSLLWVARDYLPAIVSGSGQISDESERKIDAHFRDISSALRRKGSARQTDNRWTYILIGIDVILAFVGISYFWSSRRRAT
jgi:hypothetical protein